MVSERFAGIGKAMLKSKGIPDFPMFVVPWRMEEMTDDEIRKLAEDIFPRLLEKLVEKVPVAG